MPENIILSAVLLIAVFAPLIEGGTTHLPVFIIKQFIAIAGIAVLSASYRRRSLSVTLSGLEPALLVFGAAAAYSVFIAPNKYMAFVWVQLFLFYTVFMYAAIKALSGRNGPRHAVYVVIGAGLLQAAAVAYDAIQGLTRVNGTFFNPNMMAGYVVPSFAMALSMLLIGPGRKPSRPAFWVLGICLVIIGLTLDMSGSRGGMVSLMAAVCVVAWFRFRFAALAAVVVLAALVLVIPNPVRDRVFSGDPLMYSRTDIWKSAVERIEDHPGGLGLGNYKYYSERYNFPQERSVIMYRNQARTAHNEYLHFAAEMGIPGMAAMAFLLVSILAALRRSVVAAAGSTDGWVVYGAAGGLAGIMTHSLVDSNLHEPGTVIMALLLFAVCAAMRPDRREYSFASSAAARASALGVLCLLVMAAWAATPYAAYRYKEMSVDMSRERKLMSALEYAEKAMFLEPLNPDYCSNAAATNFALYQVDHNPKMLEESLRLLGEARRLNPVTARFPSLEAYVRTEASKSMRGPEGEAMLSSALAAARRAAELSPFEADVQYRLAAVLLQAGDAAGARDVLTRLAELEPNFLKGRLLLARVHGFMGDKELSKELGESIIADYKSLSSQKMGKRERAFVSVDIDAARALTGTTREGSG